MDKLNPIPVSESLLRIKNDISAIKLSTFKELKEMVNQYHQLSLLTVRERQCLHALCRGEHFALRKAYQHDRENFLHHGQKCNK